MTKQFYILLGASLLFLGLSCCHNPGQEVIDPKPEPTKTAEYYLNLLESDTTCCPSETPFVKREFKPFLEGRWIGSGISYGCYREGQAPGVMGPSEAEILEDLKILMPHWNMIRVYGSDEDSERVLKVIHEHQLPIRVMLGMWLENETKNPARKDENLKQVTKGIELANRFPEEVIAINVGNESQVSWSWHNMEMKNLIHYIRAVRKYTSTPVTTADDYNFWNKPESEAVASEIDFLVLHAYPLWNGITLDSALTWADSVYRSTKDRYAQHTVVLGEIGWGTLYDPNKNGPGEEGALIKTVVSEEAQAHFYSQFRAWQIENQFSTFFFEAFDEPWKGGGDQTGPDVIEKHWGLFYEDRTPKPAMGSMAVPQR